MRRRFTDATLLLSLLVPAWMFCTYVFAQIVPEVWESAYVVQPIVTVALSGAAVILGCLSRTAKLGLGWAATGVTAGAALCTVVGTVIGLVDGSGVGDVLLIMLGFLLWLLSVGLWAGASESKHRAGSTEGSELG
jgi:hypothetical protein